ncbi:MAG: hypothetical protein EA376_05220 [Phycisphaeraceae bacterium]|nr:MAG: hypothetical protein EA376_05220 [Phycisphaeraceae bacterium]
MLGAGLALTACGEEEPPPPPQVQQPRQVEQRASLDDIRMDARVQFPEERLPRSQELADAIASLASAIASGDSSAMRGVLDGPSEATLASLVASGDWERETENVEAVRIVALEESDDNVRLGLAVQDASGAYLLGWEARNAGGRWLFAGLPVASATGVRAADLDGAPLEIMSMASSRSGAREPELAAPEERRVPRPQDSPARRSSPSSPTDSEPIRTPAPL